MSFGCLAHGFDHFVARLDVVQLRLQQQSFGVEFVGGGGVRLRTERGAFLQLLNGDAAGFRAQSQEFFGHFHHLPGAFEFVVGGLHAELDFFLDAGQIFLAWASWALCSPTWRAFFAAVKKIVAEVNAEGAEIAGQERNIVRIAVAGERFHIRHVLAFGETHGGGGLLDFVRAPRRFPDALRVPAQALLLAHRLSPDLPNGGIERERRRERQADGIVELHGEVRELQFRGE